MRRRLVLVRGCRVLVMAAALGCFVGWAGYGQAAARVQVQAKSKQHSVAGKNAASKGLVDINRATAAELSGLPGMGAEYARRMIAGRPYSAKNQLVERGILPKSAYESVKDSIIAHRVKK